MTGHVPLVRLSAVNPFLLELNRRGDDAQSLLTDLGLPPDIPASSEIFVASTLVYQIVERSAELADEPHLGYAIGSSLDLLDWEPIALAAQNATTVGELLTLFTMHVAEHATSTHYFLRTSGDRSTFGVKRVEEPAFAPAQNDAFYVGFMGRLLTNALGDNLAPGQILFCVSDTSCIPDPANRFRISRGDWMGSQVTFPSPWLLEKFERSRFHVNGEFIAKEPVPNTLLDSLQTALRPHLHEPDLTVDRAATICGHDRRRLSRELRKTGTTLSKEIAKLRAKKAGEDLTETNTRIADIALSVGFTDPTVFSRAFKNWTGQSPQKYRRTHRSPD